MTTTSLLALWLTIVPADTPHETNATSTAEVVRTDDVGRSAASFVARLQKDPSLARAKARADDTNTSTEMWIAQLVAFLELQSVQAFSAATQWLYLLLLPIIALLVLWRRRRTVERSNPALARVPQPTDPPPQSDEVIRAARAARDRGETARAWQLCGQALWLTAKAQHNAIDAGTTAHQLVHTVTAPLRDAATWYAAHAYAPQPSDVALTQMLVMLEPSGSTS